MIVHNRHYFELNVLDAGYSLYTIDSLGITKSHSLQVASDDIPDIYLRVRNRIGDALNNNTSSTLEISPTLAFINKFDSIFVGFGCKTNVKDEYERRGLTFIYVYKLEDANLLENSIENIIGILSKSSLDELTDKMDRVALYGDGLDSLFDYIINQIEKTSSFTINNHNHYAIPDKINFNTIVHDCYGASRIAWRTFAKFLNNKHSTWEVYDTVFTSTPKTCLMFSDAPNNELRVSEFISNRILSSLQTSIIEPNDMGIPDTNINTDEELNKISEQTEKYHEPQILLKKNLVDLTLQYLLAQPTIFLRNYHFIIVYLLLGAFGVFVLSSIKNDSDFKTKTQDNYINFIARITSLEKKLEKWKPDSVRKYSSQSTQVDSQPNSNDTAKVNTKILYKVLPQETLREISNKFSISISEIIKLNPNDINIKDSTIKVGATLYLGKKK